MFIEIVNGFMKSVVLIIVIFSICFSCKKDEIETPAQIKSFEKNYGGENDDIANSIIIEGDFLYVFGSSKSFNNPSGDYYLLKLDLDGNKIFEKTYGGSSEEFGQKIIATNDGNFLLIGSTESTGKGLRDVQVIKINKEGELIWERTYGGSQDDFPAAIIETSTSEFCIAASSKSFGNGSLDIYLIWINQQGDIIREITYGGSDLDGSADLLEIENQEIMLFAYTRNYGAESRDMYLMKLSNKGDSLWSKRYGGTGYEESQQMVRTLNGGYLLVGHSSSTDPMHNMFTLKIDEGGKEIWENEFGGVKHDGGQAELINTEGNYVFVAKSMSYGSGDRNILLVTTNTDGEEITKEVIGDSGNDMAQDIVEVGDYYYLAGESNSFGSGDKDVYLVKHLK